LRLHSDCLAAKYRQKHYHDVYFVDDVHIQRCPRMQTLFHIDLAISAAVLCALGGKEFTVRESGDLAKRAGLLCLHG